jgi:putative hemolysin
MSVGLGLSLVALIVLLNAFFVLSEYALVASRRTILAVMAEEGSKRAQSALRLKERPLRFIGTAQLGVTVASIILGAIGEPLFAGFFDTWLARGLAVAIGLVVITYLHVVIGELAPKAVALARPERMALWCSVPLELVFRMAWPLVFVLHRSADLIALLFGVRAHGAHQRVSEEEIRLMLGEAEEGGAIEEVEEEMALKVLDLDDKHAVDVMVPRPDICSLAAGLTATEALKEVATSRHTLYPVTGDTVDDVIGVLDLRDLTRAVAEGRLDENIAGMVKPVHIVPETKSLLGLLQDFQAGHTEMALIVDEYGQLEGIVTLMDLFEEIIGEISDAGLRAREPQQLEDGRLVISGQFGIDEFNERFAQTLSGEDYRTLSGFVFGELGRAPRAGDEVQVAALRFKVLAVDGTRIEQLEVELPEGIDVSGPIEPPPASPVSS